MFSLEQVQLVLLCLVSTLAFSRALFLSLSLALSLSSVSSLSLSLSLPLSRSLALIVESGRARVIPYHPNHTMPYQKHNHQRTLPATRKALVLNINVGSVRRVRGTWNQSYGRQDSGRHAQAYPRPRPRPRPTRFQPLPLLSERSEQ